MIAEPSPTYWNQPNQGPGYVSCLKLQGRDSPCSTTTVFSTSRVFHWKSGSQKIVEFKLGESRPCPSY